jgi:hypothetical protein
MAYHAEPAEPPRGCMARMLDPVALNIAVRQAFGRLDPGTALMVFVFSALFTMATGAIWWRYDLMSTWQFTQGMREDVSGEIIYMTDLAERAGAGAIIGGMLALAFTLFPSLVELIAPRVIHPGVQAALQISIWFDFVTDWPTAQTLIQRWGVPGGWLGEVAATFLLTLVLSLFVQVLFILGVTSTVMAVLCIVRGPVREARRAVVIDQ